MKWDIIPVNTGVLRSNHKGLVYGAPDEHVYIPCIVWILKSKETGEVILVDAGPTEDLEYGAKLHIPVTRTEEQYLPAALGKYGIQPEDVQTVIITHLHWDHAYGLLKMPNAKILIQRKEMQFAVAPEPLAEAKRYEANVKDIMPYYLKVWGQMEFLDGDVELRPGLKAVFLPGHSPGSQGIWVDTENGPYIMAADLINLEENWNDKKVCGGYTSLEECYDSFRKVEEIVEKTGATVLPSHDDCVFSLLAQN